MNDIFFLRNRKSIDSSNVAITEKIIKKICLYLADITISIRENSVNIEERDYFECRNSRFLIVFFDSHFEDDEKCVEIYNEFCEFKDDADFLIPIVLETSQICSEDRMQELNKVIDLSHDISEDMLSDESVTAIDRKIEKAMVDIKRQVLKVRQKKNIHIIEGEIEIPKKKDVDDKETADYLEELRQRAAEITEKNSEFKSYLPVCAIYTGGTVGIIQENDGLPLRQASLEEFINRIPHLTKLKFDVHFYSYKQAIDSSNIESNQWKYLAKFIFTMQSTYQGFVIIHGVNTMAYTASALSFMLDDVSLPIVLTGAEYPLTDFGTDAAENVIDALSVAGHLSNKYVNIPTVSVLFGKKLFRGNRVTKKVSLDAAEGFYSPNYPLLANISNDRIYGYNLTREQNTQNSNVRIKYYSYMKDPGGIVIFDIYPDMDMNVFGTLCNPDIDLQALILRTYGTGGIPDEDKKFMFYIKELLNKNVLIISLTQCPVGEVEYRLFETNSKLFYLGVVNGADMTTEAAYCKIKFLIDKYRTLIPIDASDSVDEQEKKKKMRFEEISKEMSENAKGEMSINTYVVRPIHPNNTITPSNSMYCHVELPDLNTQAVCSAIIMIEITNIPSNNIDVNADISVSVHSPKLILGKYKQKIPSEEVGENENVTRYPITINATDELKKLKAREDFRGEFHMKIESNNHDIEIGSLKIVISARVDQDK